MTWWKFWESKPEPVPPEPKPKTNLELAFEEIQREEGLPVCFFEHHHGRNSYRLLAFDYSGRWQCELVDVPGGILRVHLEAYPKPRPEAFPEPHREQESEPEQIIEREY